MCTSQTAACKMEGEPVLAVQAAQKDLAAKRREYYFALPGFLRDRVQLLLQTQDDLPILFLLWNVSITTLPIAVAVFSIPAWSHILGPLYLICSYVLFLERYLLALHYSEHKKLFKKGQHAKQRCCSPTVHLAWGVYTVYLLYQTIMLLLHVEHYLLNGLAPVFLAPLFGVPGGLYRFHHCVMHHVVSHFEL